MPTAKQTSDQLLIYSKMKMAIEEPTLRTIPEGSYFQRFWAVTQRYRWMIRLQIFVLFLGVGLFYTFDRVIAPDRQIFVAVALFLWSPILLFPALMILWQAWLVVSRPDAAGVSYKLVRGKKIWVQLKWMNPVPKFFTLLDMFTMPSLLFVMITIMYGSQTSSSEMSSIWMDLFIYAPIYFLFIVFSIASVKFGLSRRAELTADFEEKTIRVPDYNQSEKSASQAIEANAPLKFTTFYRTIPLADVKEVMVKPSFCLYGREPGASLFTRLFRYMSFPGDGLTDMDLVLILKSGEEILMAKYEPGCHNILGEFGVQLLAGWLNKHLGLSPSQKTACLSC